jgi:glycosyltransferase involved in cell wall biosynthesis
MEKPEVSIIIPTYDSGKTLVSCLGSVDNQTYPSCEVIVVDNFSRDNTSEVARSFKATVIQQKCNAALARNIGIINSTSKYVLFLDSDQTLSPTVVEECVQICEKGSTEMVRVPEIFVGKGLWSSCSAIWKNYYQRVEQLYGAHRNILSGEPRFFVREKIISVGMFNSSLVWGEDYDLHQRLKKANVKEAACRSGICHYEPTSVKGILMKNLYYSIHMPKFVYQTQRQILPKMLMHALLTLLEISKSNKSLVTIIGCTFLLGLKTYLMLISLPLGLLLPINKRGQ